MESLTNLSICGEKLVKNCYMHLAIKDSAPVLSNEGKKIFEFVSFVSLCGLICGFGIPTNIINIIIFIKQGFVITVNIAFLGLAVSDMCCLITVAWLSICMNPRLPVYDATWVSVEVMYLSGAWPHVCFSRIISYITVYITAERFISIAWPLKVKQIVTATRTAVIICLIYIVNFFTFISEYSTSHLDWRFVPQKNKTLIGIVYTKNRQHFEGLCLVLHSLFSITSFVAVVVFTFALVAKLRQTADWREKAASGHKALSASGKERKTVKMVIMIASVLIMCYTPSAVMALVTFIVGPEFDIRGRYVNICEAIWSLVFCFQSVNSSVNIFVYYRMSSKYRQTFDHIFGNIRLSRLS